MSKRPERKRSLSGLLGENPTDLSRPSDVGQTLRVDQLVPGRGQPRRSFTADALRELALSIREYGVLQPLLVRPVAGGFEIVAGERRWRAAELAGLSEVPVVIRTLDDQQARAAALIENLQRENLNVIDEVEGKLELVAMLLDVTAETARTRLIQLANGTDEDGGEDATRLTLAFNSLGETWRSYAKNKLRILNWPAALLDALREGLPRTLVGLLVKVPAEHHTELLHLIRGLSSRKDIEARIQALTTRQAIDRPHAAQVGRLLTSRRWLDALPEKDQREVETWLARMPAAVRAALQ